MIIDNKLYHYPVAVYKKDDGSGLMALIPDLPQYYKIERMASVDDALLHAALTIYGYITDTLIEGNYIDPNGRFIDLSNYGDNVVPDDNVLEVFYHDSAVELFKELDEFIVRQNGGAA